MSGRRNPFDDIERMLDRMSDQFGGEFGQVGEGGRRGVAVNVEDRGEEYVVTADLPGFDRENLDVELRDDRLHIGATRESSREAERGRYLRRERHTESVSRTVTLPEAIEKDGVSASHANGVLTVTLPKVTGGDGDGQRIDIE